MEEQVRRLIEDGIDIYNLTISEYIKNPSVTNRERVRAARLYLKGIRDTLAKINAITVLFDYEEIYVYEKIIGYDVIM